MDSLFCAFGNLWSTWWSSRCLSIQNSHWTIRLARNPVNPPITALNKATRKSCRHCCFRNSFSLASFSCCSRTLYGTTEPFAILGFFISTSPPSMGSITQERSELNVRRKEKSYQRRDRPSGQTSAGTTERHDLVHERCY